MHVWKTRLLLDAVAKLQLPPLFLLIAPVALKVLGIRLKLPGTDLISHKLLLRFSTGKW